MYNIFILIRYVVSHISNAYFNRILIFKILQVDLIKNCFKVYKGVI